MSLHPMTDEAEIAVKFPEQAYVGSFGRHSQFDAVADDDSIVIRLVRPGDDRREAVIHLHYGLLAEILAEFAGALTRRDGLDEAHRRALSGAADYLCLALVPVPEHQSA